MVFVLQDVIKELEGSRSLDALKELKKENLVKVAPFSKSFLATVCSSEVTKGTRKGFSFRGPRTHPKLSSPSS